MLAFLFRRRPRVNLTRFHGVFAPNSRYRAQITPAERGWRVVFVSTSGTVGCFGTAEESADEDAPFCEDAVRRWPYYHSKLCAEREARRAGDGRGSARDRGFT